MTIFGVHSKLCRMIRLEEENWLHIITRHSYLRNNINRIKLTLMSPDFVLFDESQNVFFYYKRFLDVDKFLVVITKHLNSEGFIISSFYSKFLKRDIVIVYEKDNN